jgi:hypothetical protein
MRQFTPRQVMVPALVAMTLVHLGIRLNGRGDGQPIHVSPLEPGAVVSLAGLVIEMPAAPRTCLQLIVFSPDCPFCQRAADREAKSLSESSRQARLWFTAAETTSLPYFVSEHLQRKPRVSAALVKTLKIQAVPALFVLSPAGEIRWVGGYTGNETDQELTDRCVLERNQEQKT